MRFRVNPPPGQDSLASLVREARAGRDLTQQDLADQIGVTVRTVQYWEAGKTPHPRHRRLLREFLEEAAA